VKHAAAVILAAGESKRMRSNRAKVLHPLGGAPMLLYVVEAVEKIARPILVVVGRQADEVKRLLAGRPVRTVIQPKQLGTAHAVLRTQTALAHVRAPVLILNGDTPLVTRAILERMIELHHQRDAHLTLLTARLSDPFGYGRIVRNSEGRIRRVVEESDATPYEKKIQEINTGIYLAEQAPMFELLKTVQPNNRQKEYYLTDLVEAAVKQGYRVESLEAADSQEVLGINTRIDLAQAEKILQGRTLKRFMLEGVTVLDPDTTWIDPQALIGRDTVIYPQVRVEGKTIIGEGCVIGSCVRLTDSQIEGGAVIRDFCVIHGSKIQSAASVGPFAHLRPGTVIKKGARIGNFVEVKMTELGPGSKANHLSYLGDAVIGRDVNIGAGTITCNYDGIKKSKTVIGDRVFVGSDTQFIAPVRIGREALIAAGSTITKDVPPRALAIARAEQANKPGWTEKRQLRVKSAKLKGKKKKTKG
jgi:bifunctional UDP-N-acetylglucosamine pyrophosphorylase / glucosamine-1-phosphate N-acetyltransferase